MNELLHIQAFDHETAFPDLDCALDEPNGLIAVGGDLSPARLLMAYRHGVFPWFEEHQPILWWSPDPRAVLYPKQLRITRSLKKSIRNRGYKVTFDANFSAVIRACSQPRAYGRDTWITEDMINAYQQLHDLGHAHSIEVWHGSELVGGLYGVLSGQMFFGESMFSLKTDASKMAFVYLCVYAESMGMPFIDCQLPNDHLMSLGAETMPRKTFKHALATYVNMPDVMWRAPKNYQVIEWM